MEKRCSMCGEKKDVSEFNRSSAKKDGLQGKCRECSNKAGRKHYEENKKYYADKRDRLRRERREWFWGLKRKLGCSRCPEDHPACIDFHHLDDNKEAGVSELVRELRKKKDILAEIKKCEPLCSNCHRKEHFDRE